MAILVMVLKHVQIRKDEPISVQKTAPPSDLPSHTLKPETNTALKTSNVKVGTRGRVDAVTGGPYEEGVGAGVLVTQQML